MSFKEKVYAQWAKNDHISSHVALGSGELIKDHTLVICVINRIHHYLIIQLRIQWGQGLGVCTPTPVENNKAVGSHSLKNYGAPQPTISVGLSLQPPPQQNDI